MKKISTLLSLFVALISSSYAQISTFPHTEGFEGTFPPIGWTQDTISGTAGWTAINGNQNTSVSAYAGSLNAYFYSANYNGDATRLVTPSINLSSLTTPELLFWHSQIDWSGDQDTLGVYYKTSAAGSWTYLTSFTNSTAWTQEVITLPNPSSDYYIAFEAFSGYGRGVTLDEFMLREQPACVTPNTLFVSDLALDSANLNWTEAGTAITWQIEYGASGFTQGTGNFVVTSNNPHALTGLTSFTNYDWYVRAICGPGDTSAWTPVSSFFTGYCSPAPSSTDGNGITNVAFDTVNHTGPIEPNYYGDYSAWIGNAGQGTTLNVDITFETGYTYDTKIWVDWNNDLDFDDPMEEVYSGTSTSASPTTLNASFVVPMATPLGQYRMRIGGADSGPITPCYTGSYASFEDYTLNVTLPPSCFAPSALSISGLALDSANLSWTENGTATTWQIEYGTSGFTQGTGNFVVTSNNPHALTGLTSFTNYDWYVRAICGPGDTSIWSSSNSFYTGYCTPAPSSTDGNGITNVAFDTVNHTGPVEPNYYGDYSAWIGNAGQGTTLTVDITFETGYTYDTKIWVDWNNDLDFDDPMEEVYSGTSTSANPTTLNASFVVPMATPLGQYRMRIGGADSGPITPCYTGSYASFEDYTLNVTIAPACIAPTNPLTASTSATQVTLDWTENNGATEWQIEYGSTGFTQGAGTIVTTTTKPETITSLSASTSYDWYVRTICGPGDTSAWSNSASFTTPCNPATAPFTESFDNTSIPSCWSQYAIKDGPWVFGTPGFTWNTSNCAGVPADHTGNGGNYAALDFSGSGVDSVALEMVDVDVSSLTTPLLTFYFTMCGTGYTPLNILYVEAWNGSTWTGIDTIQEQTNGWKEYSYDVSSFTYGSGLLRIRFRASSTTNTSTMYFGDQAIDDISIIEAPSCLTPDNLTASNINNSSADLGWSEYNAATQWQIEYGSTGFTPGTGTVIIANSNPYNLGSLTTFQSYDYYVRSICAPGDTSAWSAVSSFLIASPLSGTYTLNASLPLSTNNFQSFSGFASAINAVGVSGAVTLNVAPGTYNDQLSLGNIQGASASNTISINGMGAAILTHDGSTRNSTITLERSSWIEIKNMTIEHTATSDAWGIHLFDSTHHVHIDSNVINMPIGAYTDVAGINGSSSEITDGSSGNNAFNITISNNRIIGGERGVTLYGNFTASARNVGVNINNNEIFHSEDYGIYVYGYDTVGIEMNIVDSLNNIGSDAIYLGDVENFQLNGNYAKGQDNGFDADDLNYDNTVTNNSLVSNNMFIGGDDGVYFDDSESFNFYHNSVYSEDYGMYTNDHLNLDIRNNIFFSNSDYAFYSPDSFAITMNYNIYYTNGVSLARYGGTANIYTDLTAFQAGIPSLNINSIQGDPVFANPGVDLHVSGPLANDVGDNSVGITSDYDGDSRPLAPASTVDIGADEFTPPACLVPTSPAATNITASSADLGWVENNLATSWVISYGPAGFTAGSGTQLIVGSNPYSLGSLNAASNYDFYVRSICAPGDTSSWSATGSFATACGPVTAPYTESFDNNTIPNCWSQYAIKDGPWVFGTPGFGWNTSNCAGVPLDHTGNGGNYAALDFSGSGVDSVSLEMNDVDVSALTTPYLKFYFTMCGTGYTPINILYVDAWDGANWIGVDTIQEQTNGWKEYGYDVSGFTYSSNLLRIRFRASSSTNTVTMYFGYQAIDDVSIEEAPTCLKPTSLSAINVSSSSADLAWVDPNTAGNYEVEYGAPGFSLGTGTPATGSASPVNVTGLSAQTSYEFYVRAICAPGDTSDWAGPLAFTTPCAALTATHTEDFDGVVAPAIPNCWSIIAPGTTTIAAVTSTDHSAPIPSLLNAIEFNNSAGNDVMLISPPFSDLSTGANRLRVKIAAEGGGSGFEDTLLIGVMTDPSSPATFVAIDTIPNGTSSAFIEYIFNLNNTTTIGSAQYIAFAHIQGNGGYEFYIDDFIYEPIPTAELGVVSVDRPSVSNCGLGMETVEVTIENFGAAAQSNFQLGFSVDGTPITPETFTATIQPYSTATYIFTTNANLAALGNHSIEAYTLLAGDANPSNDTSSTSLVSLGSVSAFPYTESFESGAAGWGVDGNTSWELGAPVGTLINSASDGTQAWVTNLAGDYGNAESGAVNSPCFDFTGINNPYIRLDIWYDIESLWDGALLQASTDGGQTWTTVGQQNDPVNWYNDTADAVATQGFDPTGQSWTGDGSQTVNGSGGWINAMHALDGLGGQSNVRLRLSFVSDGATTAEGMALDNVHIYDSITPLPYYPIATINTEDVNGVADSLNVDCWTSGTVMGVDLDGNNGISFYITDLSSGSQEGINVFNFNDVSNYVVNEGDSILVRGRIIQFNGLTEMNPDSIEIIRTGATLPSPMLVSNLDETTEAKLVQLDNFRVITGSGSTSYNMTATNGTDTITIRVDADTDVNDSLNIAALNPGDTICSLIGIGSQFDSSNPYTDGYQVFPMRFSDIDTSSCQVVGIAKVGNKVEQFSIAPNPSNGEFMLSTSGFNNANVKIQICDLNGRIVADEWINNANAPFQRTFNLNDNAKGIYFISIFDGNAVANKKLILH
jgi:hypothetical protein